MSGDCPKECAQQKPDSPGPVESGEFLIYVILDPDLWKDGQLTKFAFAHDKLKRPDDGISVTRATHSSPEKLKRNVIDPQLAKKPERKFIGAIIARCADVRELRLDTQEKPRSVCVIDDGLPENSAHALLNYSEAAKIKTKDEAGRSHKQAIRSNLISKFRGAEGPFDLDAVFAEAARLAG